MSLQLAALTGRYVEFDFTRMAFDTRVSFSRSSDGTYFDAAGVMQTAASNVLRKEHNPATGAVRGLLVEEQRTNLFVRSSEIDNASWLKARCSVSADATSAPDSTLTADKIIADTQANPHFVAQTITTSSTNYGFSVFAKKAEWENVFLFANNTTVGSYFNLTSGTIVGSLGSPIQSSITPLVGSWFHLYMQFSAIVGSNQVAIRIGNANIQGPVGNGVNGAYIWGAQLEVGSSSTSYIPTTTATVTRSADVATFTIPPRVVRLVTIYDDGTSSQQTVTPGASYTIPTGQKPILRIRGYFA